LGFTTFASATARFIAQELARDEDLRAANYQVEVRVWLSPSGHLERYELIRGTGDPDLDRKIRDGLAQVGNLRQSIPEGLPQPIRIRVTSSDA
jgi:TonB family protein